jgi:hypothetical protein
MQSAVDLDIDQLRIRRDVTRQRHCRSHSRYRLLAIFAVFTTTFGLCLSASEPALADGSLETMEGGLFHRKGWIDPEIYRRKPKRTRRKRASRRTASRTRHSTSSATRPCTASRPNLITDVEPSERELARPINRDSKVVRVASLTTTVPLLSLLTGPEINITGSAPCIKWAASSRCIPERLHAAINHVARHYGRVRVNSTCRSRRHNRRVGGAPHSYHLRGRAADIRVYGNIRAAARYLRRVAGGYKHYGGGLFHIDTGPKRSW